MNGDELRALQAPLKEKYRAEPATAKVTLIAKSDLGAGVSCSIQTGKAMVEAGLHPAAGGDGTQACSGDMLLESLAACYAVTLKSVATALNIPVTGGSVTVEGVLDFRGTLGVVKDAPVGFESLRVKVAIAGNVSDEQRANLMRLTDRYCVVLQTLRSPLRVDIG
jgi:uncharacterized OsmC-like protein